MLAKMTMYGAIMTKENLLDCISYPFLTEAENDTLKMTFELRHGERPIIDFNPLTFEAKLQLAVRLCKVEAERLYNLYTADYNPIENYDRIEESRVTSDSSTATESDSKNRITNEGHSATENSDSAVSNNTSTNNVSTFDSKALSVHDRRDDIGNSRSEGATVTSEEGVTDNLNETHGATTTEGNTTTVSRIHGNIGVTTTQQMIVSSLDLLTQFNYFETIADMLMQKSQAFYYLFN